MGKASLECGSGCHPWAALGMGQTLSLDLAAMEAISDDQAGSSVCPFAASMDRGGDLRSRERWGSIYRETGQWCHPDVSERGCHGAQHLCYSPSPPFVPAASAGLLENCTGCVLCSEDNGCITCHHRLFLLIWRDGIRQYGMCVHTCPPGYFGVRGLEVNRCTSTSCASRGPPAPTSAPCSPRRPAGPSAAGRAMASFPAASLLVLDPGPAGLGGLRPLFPCPELPVLGPGGCRGWLGLSR